MTHHSLASVIPVVIGACTAVAMSLFAIYHDAKRRRDKAKLGAKVALEDDFGAKLVARKSSIPRDLDLGL